MKHLATDGYVTPVCLQVFDKMSVFDVADPSRGEKVTCPRCLAVMEFYKDEENNE